MELIEAIKNRRSVRSYTDQNLEGQILSKLQEIIESTNRESGLNFQLILNEPKAFDTMIARYGNFSNVKNYIALIGKNSPNLGEDCGYYGEKVVLEIQRMGLNTCWVGGTYKKVPEAFHLRPDEKQLLVIAVGFGVPGSEKPHKSKKFADVVEGKDTKPVWFIQGIEAALLAPTAMNQQNFKFALEGDNVRANAGWGFYTKVDLGIVKYHFEIGSGKDHNIWVS